MSAHDTTRPIANDAWCVDEQRLHSLVENASDLITVVGPDLTIVFQTGAVAELLDYRADELEGTKFAALVDPTGLAQLRASCAEAADGVANRPVQLRLQRRDGSWIDGETVVRYEREDGLLVLTTRNVHERKRAELQLRRRAAQQTAVARLGAEALAGEQLPELMERACAEVASTLGAECAAVFEYLDQRELFALAAGVGVEAAHRPGAPFAAHRSQPGLAKHSARPVIVRDWTAETRFDEADFLIAHGVASGLSVRIPGPNVPFGVISVQSSVRNRFSYDDGVFLQAIANILAAAIARSDGEEKIRHQALHDSVTGLPNRMLFEDRLRTALASARRHKRRLAVVFLDLDNFKRVNDSLGHAVGDVMLSIVADRLSECLRAEDTLARFGGDEFALLLPEVEGEHDVVLVVQRMQDALRTPLCAEGRNIVTSASVGIAIGGAERETHDAPALVRDADLAMYAAKQRGPGGWEFFAEHMYETAVKRLDLTGDLYAAIEHDELEVHYQPIVALNDEEIVGMEALVRWKHPKHGLLPPIAFIPLAEETGLIVRLGRTVLRDACTNLRRWQLEQPRHRDLYVTVNLSTQEIQAPDLAAYVKGVLVETGLVPSSLILEITENVLLSPDDSVMTRLLELKELGVRLAVDDFGTGYSALSYLQRFPIDILKIAKTFVDGLGDNNGQDRLVRGIIDLAHALDLKTVAEGIEHAEQAAALRTMHSELGQGFHFAKPLTTTDMNAVLAPVPLPDHAEYERAEA